MHLLIAHAHLLDLGGGKSDCGTAAAKMTNFKVDVLLKTLEELQKGMKAL